MVPGDDPVVDPQHGIWQREIVIATRRQTLESPAPVVREVASGSALKRRKPIDRVTAMWAEQLRDLREDISPPPSTLLVVDLRLRALAHNNRYGICREKGIAAEACARRRAVEKQPVWQAGQPLAAARRIESFGELNDRGHEVYPAR